MKSIISFLICPECNEEYEPSDYDEEIDCMHCLMNDWEAKGYFDERG